MKSNTKIGDVFSVEIDSNHKKYFQYVVSDLTQLNSDVIRAFKKIYPINTNPDLSEIINEEVEFYAHCVTKLGLKMKLWQKVGNTTDIGNPTQILFKDTNDYGTKVGEEPIRVSQKWYVWRVNDKDFTRVGKLEGANRKAEIGIVVNPYDITERMKTGKYRFIYPDVLDVLQGTSYFYFTSNKSSILELCEWVETKMGSENPFNGAIRHEVNVQMNYHSSYTDMMLYKHSYTNSKVSCNE